MAIKIEGSDMPAENSYGQNGYTGPVSVPAPKGKFDPGSWQTREVSDKPLATRVGPGKIAQWK